MGLLCHLLVNDWLRDLRGQLDCPAALSCGTCVRVSGRLRAVTGNLGRFDPCVQVTPIPLSLFSFGPDFL